MNLKFYKISFENFYPQGKNIKKYIYHFNAFLPKKLEYNKNDIFRKFDITTNYFYCSNQFWIHKNHLVLFEAVKLVKTKIKDILLICSGNTTDYRNSDYFDDLLKFIHNNDLDSNIKIVGLIDRNDQLGLMKESIGIIQPSLFEGWNTSIEEAKAMGKLLILSDIEVHKEQASSHSIFFQKNSPTSLADIIIEILTDNTNIKIPEENNNYSPNLNFDFLLK